MMAFLRPQLRFVAFASGKLLSECPIYRFEDAPLNSATPFANCMVAEKRSDMELDLMRAIYMPSVTPICGPFLKSIKKDKKHPLVEREKLSMDVRARLTSSHGFVDSLVESRVESFFFSHILNDIQDLVTRIPKLSNGNGTNNFLSIRFNPLIFFP